MERKRWENDVRNALTTAVKEDWPLFEHVTWDEIRLEGEYPDTEVVFLFRTSRRLPDCRFGWKWGPLWEPRPNTPEQSAENDSGSGQTSGMLSVVFANFCEAVDLDPPEECELGVITWLP